MQPRTGQPSTGTGKKPSREREQDATARQKHARSSEADVEQVELDEIDRARAASEGMSPPDPELDEATEHPRHGREE